MGSVRIVEAGSIDWQPVHEAVAPEVAEKMSQAERDGDVRIIHPGIGGGLQLFEARIDPDLEVSLHAHAKDEIIYILEGELLIGRKRLGPGASVFVGGNTLYGFRAGPEGVRFLNFRGESNTTFITKEQFMENRPRKARE
jgi:quercetin dioxygenase-like cupin family protein